MPNFESDEVLDFELHGEVWEESAPPRTAWWIKVTAVLVLVAFIAPILGAVLGRF